jgi:Arc/MetJ-type ribon-helix-helix transcriptional regulator
MSRIVKSFSIAAETWTALVEEAKRRGVSKSQIVNEALGERMRTKIERDEWDTVSSSRTYDPKHFYTASENAKGFSNTVKFAVPKGILGQVQRLVNSGNIPEYRSSSDFFRDAAMHRLKQVAAWVDDGELDAQVDLTLMIFREEQIAQQKSDAELLISRMRTNLEDALGRGDYNWMREHLIEKAEEADSIPEQHRSLFLNVLADYQDKLGRISPKYEIPNIIRD